MDYCVESPCFKLALVLSTVVGAAGCAPAVTCGPGTALVNNTCEIVSSDGATDGAVDVAADRTAIDATMADVASDTGTDATTDVSSDIVVSPDAPTSDVSVTDVANDTGPAAAGFPSNFDATMVNTVGVPDFAVDETSGDCALNTDTGAWVCNYHTVTGPRHQQIILPGTSGAVATVWVVNSLIVGSSSDAGRSLHTLRTAGSLPAIIYALTTVRILGNGLVIANAGDGYQLNSFDSMVTGATSGHGGAGAGMTSATAGGGSFCGMGGAGALYPDAGMPAGGMLYGTPSLIPLVSGSMGGGDFSGRGAGGGALQISAGTSITVEYGGAVSAPGAGGIGAGDTRVGGGGSGGGILLEAPAVTIAGTLAANGGGGGDMNGLAGRPATADNIPAAGAIPGGGNGSGGPRDNGAPGTLTGPDLYQAGGGGGGAGRIRVNARAGGAVLTGATLSPAQGSPCFTVGAL